MGARPVIHGGQRSGFGLRPARLRWGFAAALGAPLLACSENDSDACGANDCDLPRDRAELLERLEGFTDPVAEWLRTAANDAGAVDGDHAFWRAGLAAQLGCSVADERAFVVLSNAGYEPKVLLAQCANDPVAASRLFTVFEPEEQHDVDPQRFRITAWDEAASRYHRYQVAPTDDGLTVDVEPDFCRSCHGGPYDVPDWSPIMNEMTNPWAQWNAEPGFASFAFAELPAQTGPVFDALVEGDRLDSASNLEPIIRAAIDRTTAARIAARAEAPDLDHAVSLIRPVFCDENVNFVSEIHDSGEIALSAVIDAGLRRALAEVRPGAKWRFLLDDALQLPPASADEPALVLVAVRGETTVQVEAALLSRSVLTPIDVLRVRAIDWLHPVDSTARCDRFEAAAQRAKGGALAVAAFADTAELARALFDQALEVPGGSLADAGPDAVVALADATDAAALARIDAGDLADATITIDALGDAIEAEVDAHETPAGRARLATARIVRGCAARATYPTAPLIPGTDDCP